MNKITDDITEADDVRTPEEKADLHPQEDLTQGDEGIDDSVTTTLDGETSNKPD